MFGLLFDEAAKWIRNKEEKSIDCDVNVEYWTKSGKWVSRSRIRTLALGLPNWRVKNAVTWPHFRPHCAVKGIQKWPGLHTDSNNNFDFCRMLKMAVNTKPRVVYSTEHGQKLAWCGFLCCQDVIGLRMLDNAWRCTTNRRISMAWHIHALTDLGLVVIGLIWALRHDVQSIPSWLPIRFDRLSFGQIFGGGHMMPDVC